MEHLCLLFAGPLTTGKIVFTAPSRPLVMQQIEACHNIVGIPQVRTVLACLWDLLNCQLLSGQFSFLFCYII